MVPAFVRGFVRETPVSIIECATIINPQMCLWLYVMYVQYVPLLLLLEPVYQFECHSAVAAFFLLLIHNYYT